MSLLAVDVGNSRIKWGLHDGTGWTILGASNHADLESLAFAWKGLGPEFAIGSNVAGGEIARRLESLCPALSWIKPLPAQCGVVNGYEPDTLGADRWAALVGARKLLPEGGLVIDLGTAMTIDRLDRDGKFDGGVIAPGLKAMLDSLKSATPLDPGEGHFAFFAKNTNDAVLSGAILALTGAIEKMSRSLGDPQCLLSGGDAACILPHLNARARIADNLVLEGLVLISGESA